MAKNKPAWTKAREHSYIVSALRRAWLRHPHRTEALGHARVSRGAYLCAGCGKIGPPSLPPKPGNKQRINNAAVDHRVPIVSPETGFTDWGSFVERLFCPADGLQVLCAVCHRVKTEKERQVAAERRRREKSGKG